MLGNLAVNIVIMEREDSLQRIAAMPEEDRKDFVKKLVKDIRKAQGLKEETVSAGPTIAAPSLFPTSEAKGEWYFYNTSSRTRGESEFRAKWGTRPNMDNWRRSASINAGVRNQQGNSSNPLGNTNQAAGTASFEELYANLPVTQEQLKKSNDSLQAAMFAAGKIFVQQIEDCDAGIKVLEQLRSKFPQFEKMDEVLFSLYYCYDKKGESAKAAAIKKLMGEKYPNSNLSAIVTTGKNPKAPGNADATKTYERIYDLFIEGNFDQAIAEKKMADSLYGKNYWTPQLLYIESVYYIKQRNDEEAKKILNTIVSQFPKSPLAVKAANMINVLGRRNAIEEELRKLVVTRNEDAPPINNTVVYVQPKTDTVKTQPVTTNTNPTIPKKDTVISTPPVNINVPYKFNANEPYYVVLVLNKVDPVFGNEAKNALARYNKETYFNKAMTADLVEIDAENRIVLMWPFKDAQEAVTYVESTRPKTQTDILPWLKGGKYSFMILSDSNLDLLKGSKNLDTYRAFLNQHFPGKF